MKAAQLFSIMLVGACLGVVGCESGGGGDGADSAMTKELESTEFSASATRSFGGEFGAQL